MSFSETNVHRPVNNNPVNTEQFKTSTHLKINKLAYTIYEYFAKPHRNEPVKIGKVISGNGIGSGTEAKITWWISNPIVLETHSDIAAMLIVKVYTSPTTRAHGKILRVRFAIEVCPGCLRVVGNTLANTIPKP